MQRRKRKRKTVPNEVEQIDAYMAIIRNLVTAAALSAGRSGEARLKNPNFFPLLDEADKRLLRDVRALNILTAMPERYQFIIETRAPQLLLYFTQHANLNIALEAAGILSELLDDDITDEFPDNTALLSKHLNENRAVQYLTRTLSRLAESSISLRHALGDEAALFPRHEEIKAFNKIVSVLEVLLEHFDGKAMLLLLYMALNEKLHILNRQKCGEVVSSILIDNSDLASPFLCTHNTLNSLMETISTLGEEKEDDPLSYELCSDLLDILSELILSSEGKAIFLEFGGLDYVVKNCESKKFVMYPSFRLTSSLLSDKSKDTAHEFIQARGLGYLFGNLGGVRISRRYSALIDDYDEYDEYILESLLDILEAVEADQGDDFDEFIRRFSSRDTEAIAKLIDLHQKYAEREIEREEDDDEEEEDEMYPCMLADALIFALHHCTSELRSRIDKELSSRGMDLNSNIIQGVKDLVEYLSKVDDQATRTAWLTLMLRSTVSVYGGNEERGNEANSK